MKHSFCPAYLAWRSTWTCWREGCVQENVRTAYVAARGAVVSGQETRDMPFGAFADYRLNSGFDQQDMSLEAQCLALFHQGNISPHPGKSDM